MGDDGVSMFFYPIWFPIIFVLAVLLFLGSAIFFDLFTPTEATVKRWHMRFFMIRLIAVWVPDHMDGRPYWAARLLVENLYLNAWELKRFVDCEYRECLFVAAQNPRTPRTSLETIVSSPKLRNEPGVMEALLTNPRLKDSSKVLWALECDMV